MGLRAIFILTIVAIGIYYTFRKPYFGLILFTLMTYIRPERLSYEQLRPFRLFLVVSICALLAYIFNKTEQETLENHSKVVFWLFALAILKLLSTPFAVVSMEWSFKYATDFLKIAIFCYLMTKMLTSEDKVKWFLVANLIGVAFIALWGFEQHFRGNVRLEKVAGGNYAESNAIGALFAQFAPIFLSLFFVIKKKYRYVSLVMVFILIADIIFTQSRAALLGVVIGLFSFWLLVPLRIKAALMIILVISMPWIKNAVVGTEGYVDRINRTIEEEHESGADRVPIWIAGLHMVKDHPIIGVGQQNFQFLSKQYCINLGLKHSFRRLGDAHNLFLLTAAETGIFGFIALIAAFIYHFADIRYLKKAWLTDVEYSHYKPILIGLQGGMLAFMVCSMFHSLSILENLYWFLVVPGLMKNIYVARKNQPAVDTGMVREEGPGIVYG